MARRAGEPKSVRGRRPVLVIAGAYLALAWGCILYAWLNPGTYSLNLLLPFLVTAPASLIAVGVVNALGLQRSLGLAPVVLAGCGLIQAAVVYALFSRKSA